MTLAEATGAVVHARRVIMAVPPVVAGRIAYARPLPADKARLFRSTPMTGGVKAFWVYDRPFWCDKGLSGSVLSDSQLLPVVSDASPPRESGTDDGVGILLGAHDPLADDRLRNQPQEVREKLT